MVEVRDKALEIVKKEGPIIPSKIASELNMNLLFASAILSELSASGLVKVSNIKVGGSPLYYLEEQKEKLQEYAKRLHEKEKRTFDELKQKKVMRDSELDLLHKVTLRNIKDFAIPFEVNIGNDSELFWKWYLSTDDEIKFELDKMFGFSEETKKKEIKPLAKEDYEAEKSGEKIEQQQVLVQEKPEEKIRKEKKARKSKRETPEQETIKQAIEEREKQERMEDAPLKEAKLKKEKKPKTETSEFMNQINEYFKQNSIEVLESSVIKKSAEFDFILNIPSTVGKVKYYCKARKKIKIDETDLSSAYVQGEFKKLPVLYLTTGVFTKKAAEMLENEFKSIAVNQLK